MSRQNKPDKVNNFRVSIVNDESHKTVWEHRFTRTSFGVMAVSTTVVIVAIVFSLIAFTPVRTAIPGYPDAHSKRQAIQNAIKIDSLENIITRWDFYAENLARVVEGREPIKIDSIIQERGELSYEEYKMEELLGRDSLLRQIVQYENQFNVSGAKERELPIEGMHFFVPLKGVISNGYTPTLHPYVDITAPANSVVMSVLDGTVIFTGWTDDSGYTIQIQHSNDIVSIYKHNQKLMKRVGDKVSAGTSIALVGGSESLATGDHLHFELWYKGEAVDPGKYINF